MVIVSPLVRDREWNTRIAANAFLSGLSRAEFARVQKVAVNSILWGKWVRDPGLKADLLKERLADFDRIAADPMPILRELEVRYVALDTDRPAALIPHIRMVRWAGRQIALAPHAFGPDVAGLGARSALKETIPSEIARRRASFASSV
jgi:hypothetical protein